LFSFVSVFATDCCLVVLPALLKEKCSSMTVVNKVSFHSSVFLCQCGYWPLSLLFSKINWLFIIILSYNASGEQNSPGTSEFMEIKLNSWLVLEFHPYKVLEWKPEQAIPFSRAVNTEHSYWKLWRGDSTSDVKNTKLEHRD